MSGGGDIVVVVGPTAVGKSALGLRLARDLGGEIVSADSVQVYRGFDIGSAKPDADEQAAVPHHLIDIRDPADRYSAAEFVADADAAVEQIGERGRLPVVVGGTGLYVRSLLHGLSTSPPADPAVRARLQRRVDAGELEVLFAQLGEVDPVAAARIHPRDAVRIMRALEVWELTGEPLSAQQAAHGLQAWRHRAAIVGLTAPRRWLHARVNARSEAMAGAGLLAEVERLRAAGVPEGAQAFGAIGYREAVAVCEGRLSAEAFVDTVARETRRFVKRQTTWFRGQRGVRWLDASRLDAWYDDLVEALARWREGAAFAFGHDDERACRGETESER